MICSVSQFDADDIFILGNIAAVAVHRGYGARALPLLKLVQEARPTNAGAFMLEAMHLYAIGERTRAITFLEHAKIQEKAINRDEALVFYLFLLQQDGQFDRAITLGRSCLESQSLNSERARQEVRIVVAQCETALEKKRNVSSS
ncbi:hypothetical protein [Brucella intermedia]|uniref:hypothetical protein n=1 Tax=Brucella intermedia TaxID=94625 RepID=UPI00235EF758|nr:hypothetical protein [Brucella intermedia]